MIALTLVALQLGACGDSPPPAQPTANQTPEVQPWVLRPRAAATVAPTATPDTPQKPIAASNTEGFTQVAAGENHTCALRGSGQAVCWGANDQGQLDAPEELRFQQITSGWRFSCGIQTDGRVACWGRNNHQQADPPDGRFTTIDAGWDHVCALSGPVATCWGWNANERASPPPNITFAAIGAGAEHSCGLSTSGGLVCWGKNDNGRADSRDGPFRALTVGIAHTCVLRNDGTALCQGENSTGQSDPPARVFVQLSAGSDHTCGMLAEEHVECWGGSPENAASIPFSPPGQFESISAGWLRSCAVNRDKQVACWPTAIRPVLPTPFRGLLWQSLGQTFSAPTEVFPWPDGGLAVVERAGSIVVATPEQSISPVLDITGIVGDTGTERGLLSVAIDPQFETYRFVYVYYTMENPNDKESFLLRLSRFPVANGQLVPEQELVILEFERDEQCRWALRRSHQVWIRRHVISRNRRRQLL